VLPGSRALPAPGLPLRLAGAEPSQGGVRPQPRRRPRPRRRRPGRAPAAAPAGLRRAPQHRVGRARRRPLSPRQPAPAAVPPAAQGAQPGGRVPRIRGQGGPGAFANAALISRSFIIAEITWNDLLWFFNSVFSTNLVLG